MAEFNVPDVSGSLEQGWRFGFTVDRKPLADYLRKLADGIEGGQVIVQKFETQSSVQQQDFTIDGLKLTFCAKHHPQHDSDIVNSALSDTIEPLFQED